MYVFVREDLSAPQIAVQSCHACIEASHAFSLGSLPDHPSVIIIGVKNEKKLHQVRQFLIENSIQHAHFYERDLDDELTALATEPICGDRRRLFRKFQLLKSRTTSPDGKKTQYAVRYVDGGFFRWNGDCASSHRTGSIEHADLFDERSSALYTCPDGEAVEVEVSFSIKGGAK